MSEPLTHDVASVIDEAPISAAQWRVLSICLLSALLDGYDTQGIAYVAPLIARDLGFPAAQLGAIFSAGVLGLTIGAIVFGMLADKVGRKQAIIWPMVIFGIFSIATPLAQNMPQLVALRLLAGIGLGGTLPNVIAYVLEYSPKRMRALLVNCTGVCFALGSIVSGVAANLLIPALGWKSTFYVGGVAPLLFVAVAALYLPESVRFLLLTGREMRRAATIMMEMVPSRGLTTDTRYALEQQMPGVTVKHLFSDGRGFPTILLWIAFAMNLFVLTYVVFWLPQLLRQSGHPLSLAIQVTVWYGIGGMLGGIFMGWLGDRTGQLPKILACGYFGAAIFIAVAAWSIDKPPLLILAVALAGFSVNGGQPCLNTITAIFYPTAIRSTGIGWALGIGRMGAILGPMIGGILVGAKFAPSTVILANVIPSLIGLAAIVMFLMVQPKRPSAIIAGVRSIASP